MMEEILNKIRLAQISISDKIIELSDKHFDDGKPDTWDDDEAYGKYLAYSDCEDKLLEILKEYKK